MVTLPIHIRAVFRDGKFIPQEPCELPDAAEVQLTVEQPNITPPKITDPAQRARMLKEVVQRMMANPIPADAPRFTREELHERR
jgi:AF2212-like